MEKRHNSRNGEKQVLLKPVMRKRGSCRSNLEGEEKDWSTVETMDAAKRSKQRRKATGKPKYRKGISRKSEQKKRVRRRN